MQNDPNFLAMSASGLFYHGGTNNTALLTSISGATGSFGAFTPLEKGIAAVEDIAPSDPVDPTKKIRLDGSKWVVVR